MSSGLVWLIVSDKLQFVVALPQAKGSSDQVDDATSAEGAAEGSQGRSARRAAPGSEANITCALKGRAESSKSPVLYRPFRATILDDSIPGVTRCALHPGYLLPRLRRWLSRPLNQSFLKLIGDQTEPLRENGVAKNSVA